MYRRTITIISAYPLPKRTSEKLFFYIQVLGFAPPSPPTRAFLGRWNIARVARQFWGENDWKSPKLGGFRGRLCNNLYFSDNLLASIVVWAQKTNPRTPCFSSLNDPHEMFNVHCSLFKIRLTAKITSSTSLSVNLGDRGKLTVCLPIFIAWG